MRKPSEIKKEIVDVLAQKLKDEGTYFRKSDIRCYKTKTGFDIIIKDYEHIPFHLTMEEDDYFGKCVFIRTPFDEDCAIFKYGKTEFPIYTATLSLGYYIGTRF